MAGNRKRPSRLGRGLSSLMAQSVPTTPPDETSPEEAEVAEAAGAAEAAAETEAEIETGARGEGEAPAHQGATAQRATGRQVAGGGAAEPEADASPAAASTKTKRTSSAGPSAAPGAKGASPSAEDKTPPASASPTRGHDQPGGDDADEPAGDGLRYIPLDRLHPNPHQPRQHFDETALRRLAESIRSDGLMQPIVVRPAPATGSGAKAGGGAFEIVAGERRWRAAALAELSRVPAIVRELDDRALAEWALIENLQREDLNPIERAEAFQGLAERFGLGHDEIAGRVGLERSTISNLLRLLQLSDFVQGQVRDGVLSMGQARAIAGIADADEQRKLAERAIKQGLSVRQVEQLARQIAGGQSTGGQGKADAGEPSRGQVRSAYLADLEQQLAEQLQTGVKVRPGRKKGSGTLTIEFYSLDQFDALMEKLGVRAE